MRAAAARHSQQGATEKPQQLLDHHHHHTTTPLPPSPLGRHHSQLEPAIGHTTSLSYWLTPLLPTAECRQCHRLCAAPSSLFSRPSSPCAGVAVRRPPHRIMSLPLDYSSSSHLRPHMKRGRHSTAPSSHAVALSDESDWRPLSTARPSHRHSLPPAVPCTLSPALSATPDWFSSSPLDSTLCSPTTSPLSPSRDVSACSTASSSSSSPPCHALHQSPAQSMKRLCLNYNNTDHSMDDRAESAGEENDHRFIRSHSIQPPPPQHQQYQQQQQVEASSSSLSQLHAGSRVLVRARRQYVGSISVSVTPNQSQPNSRPSTAASSTIRASFNLTQPTRGYSILPHNSAPTSTQASPCLSANTSPQTRCSTILSSSLPSGGQSFLSLLNVSCASANSSFSSPAHSPSGAAFHCSSQQGTPSSAHSSASFRPHIMSAQERAALFPLSLCHLLPHSTHHSVQ